MIRAFVSLSVTLALSVLGLAAGVSPASAGGHPPMHLGPGDAHVSGIGGEALIRKSKWGYVYIAGQQHSHLRIKYIEKRDALRYRDTGTRRVRSLPKNGCHREKVKKGISVVCGIPKKFQNRRMFVQVWPRLGNDYVDARTLPAKFRLWALVDAGRDVVYGGAGDDFVNGAKDGDRIFGGPGDDFLRSGPGADYVRGGPGHDRIGRE